MLLFDQKSVDNEQLDEMDGVRLKNKFGALKLRPISFSEIVIQKVTGILGPWTVRKLD